MPLPERWRYYNAGRKEDSRGCNVEEKGRERLKRRKEESLGEPRTPGGRAGYERGRKEGRVGYKTPGLCHDCTHSLRLMPLMAVRCPSLETITIDGLATSAMAP